MKHAWPLSPTACTHARWGVSLSLALSLAACGGGEGDEASENANPATSVAFVGAAANASASRGATLWAQACAGCHGSVFANARDSSRTLWAISANRGGMGYLASTIGAQQSDDIAAYMATR